MIIWIHGPSGAGKSLVGARLAERLGKRFVDIDREVERREGRSILDIFSEVSETGFRTLEWNALVDLVDTTTEELVVALGGGAVIERSVRRLCRSTGLRVFLDVSVEAATARIINSDEVRPLLFEDDPARTWERLYRNRLPWYRDADVRIDSSGDPADVVDRLISAVECLLEPAWSHELRLPAGESSTVQGYASPYVVAQRLQRIVADSIHAIVTDTGVLDAVGELISSDDRTQGEVLLTLEQGEGAKTMTSVSSFVDVLRQRGMTRDGIIVGIGGGVVTDVAGFLASIYMRGLASIYVPTTLASQVDAAIGGKTAVNASGVRNLLGTVWQPTTVLIGSGFLHTLPARELRSGFVEVVKMGIANSAELDECAWRVRDDIIAGVIPDTIDDVISRSVETKLAVVRNDATERGDRMSLNLGHTFGHALESVLPDVFSHGEAVAVGILAAAEYACMAGRISSTRLVDIADRILPFIPGDLPSISIQGVQSAMRSDKKRMRGACRLVLPRDEVGYDIVLAADDSRIADALSRAIASAREYHCGNTH